MNTILERKKRRGFIEKKRRDRLNNCLVELKRLVPQAAKRELSEKLEKADILQMAVDYLKTTEMNQDTDKPIDYKDMGFRDCIFEVSRFFSDMDEAANPFHLRLLSHLQYFAGSGKMAKSVEASLGGGATTKGLDFDEAIVNRTASYLLNYQSFLLTLAKALCDQNTLKFSNI